MGSFIKKISHYSLHYNPFDYFVAKRVLRIRARIQSEENGDFIYWIFWRAFKLLAKKLFLWTAEGSENIPKSGPCVIISNHNHFADPVLISVGIRREMSYVSKIENYDVPFLRTLLIIGFSIPIRRGKKDLVAFQQMRRVLQKNGIVGMFPEGTRSKTGKMRHFHTGAARICLEMGVPYVPVAIKGTHKFKPKHPVRIKIGKPITITKPHKLTYELAKDLSLSMEKNVKKELAKLR